VAAYPASANSSMAGESAEMAAAEAAVTGKTTATAYASAMNRTALRPQRHSQEKRQRRDGHQATHTKIIRSIACSKLSNFSAVALQIPRP
jgi:phage/plasmid primase-like uncharacterized protein